MDHYTALLFLLLSVIAFSCSSGAPRAKEEVSFETGDGGKIFADLYGRGDRAVVLAHGAVFNKESWSALASRLSAAGYRVLAIDFRGYGKSVPGGEKDALYEDILGAIRYLKARGAKKVSVIGGSMGAQAAARAAVRAKRGEVDRLILLSPPPIEHPEKIRAGLILYVASRDEPLAPRVQAQFEGAPEPKRLELLEGAAHAQHLFKTEQAEPLTELILMTLAD